MSQKPKAKHKNDLLSLLDFVILLGKEQAPESYAYAFNENGGMLTVAESAIHDTADPLPIGYQASRIASGTMDALFQLASNHTPTFSDEYLASFAETYHIELYKHLLDHYTDVPPVSFGTFLVQCQRKMFYTGLISEGNVRMFLLTSQGLILLSPEDFSSDVWHRTVSCSLPGLLLCVSDACFRRFDGPMDFEYILLDTLCDSQTIEGWKSLLTRKIANESKDSFLLLAASFGYGTFQSLHKAFSNRKSNLYWNFLAKDTTATPFEAQEMVKAYNKVYLSYQTDPNPEEPIKQTTKEKKKKKKRTKEGVSDENEMQTL